MSWPDLEAVPCGKKVHVYNTISIDYTGGIAGVENFSYLVKVCLKNGNFVLLGTQFG